VNPRDATSSTGALGRGADLLGDFLSFARATVPTKTVSTATLDKLSSKSIFRCLPFLGQAPTALLSVEQGLGRLESTFMLSSFARVKIKKCRRGRVKVCLKLHKFPQSPGRVVQN
jgi:hypothetical protein